MALLAIAAMTAALAAAPGTVVPPIGPGTIEPGAKAEGAPREAALAAAPGTEAPPIGPGAIEPGAKAEGAPREAALAAAPVRVVIETGLGVIEIEVNVGKAPRTAANFLRYVDSGHYDGGRFHRTVKTKPDNQPQSPVKIDVVQAGARPGAPQFEPIALERTSVTGLKHLDGVVSMARSGPDTATSDIFICIGDQPALDFGGARNPDGQGFAAFGRVVKGMDVVRRIQTAPAQGQALIPPVAIVRARRR